MVLNMAYDIKEIDDSKCVMLGKSMYVRVPSAWLKELKFKNIDGTKKTLNLKRALIRGKKRVIMGVWGTLE